MSAFSIVQKADKVSDFTISKLPKNNRQFYKVLHDIADRATPAVRREFLRALESIKGSAKIKDLQIALEMGDSSRVFTALGMNKLNVELAAMVTTLREAYNNAAIAAGKVLPKEVQIGYRFDMFNPRAVDYAQRKSAELVTRIGQTTREGIQAIITEGVEAGLTVTQQATRIKELVGLLPRQVRALDTYKSMLIAEGRKPAQVKNMAERYRQRLLRARATMIARTETINAVNAGQEEAWAQAMDEGLIKPGTMKKWIVTPDDLLCPVCSAIPKMNPDGVPVGSMFDTPKGPKMGPTAHPHCRCGTALMI